MSKCYVELNQEFSDTWCPRFKQLYDRVHKTQNCHHVWWAYVLHPSRLKRDYLDEFPWLTEIPSYDINDEKNTIIFFRSNGQKNRHVKAHVDPNEIDWSIVLPVQNCTDETVTNWVEPIGDVVEERAKTSAGNKDVKMLGNNTKIIDSYCFTNKAALFNGGQWHEVRISHNRDEDRVLGKLWTPKLSKEHMLEVCKQWIN